MLVHSVYFWLKSDLPADQRKEFLRRLEDMKAIPVVRWFFVGTPSATDRPVIDRSYTYALVVAFDDMAGHDAYQAHPLHDAFRDHCAKMWSKVVIYDPEN